MDIFRDVHSIRNTERDDRLASHLFENASVEDKLDSFDRFVDTSSRVSVQEKRSLKVDRVDRYRLTPRVR